MNKPVIPIGAIRGEEHWTDKGADVRLIGREGMTAIWVWCLPPPFTAMTEIIPLSGK